MRHDKNNKIALTASVKGQRRRKEANSDNRGSAIHQKQRSEHFVFNTMASVSFLTRTVARRTFDKVARLTSTSSKLGGVRFSSYFTPGTSLLFAPLRN